MMGIAGRVRNERAKELIAASVADIAHQILQIKCEKLGRVVR